MDELAKVLATSSPIAAVILLLGTQALQVWRTELILARHQRSVIGRRLTAIEIKLGLPDRASEMELDENN